ncbi:LPXTG-anchored fibrillar adhesin CshA [Streptococcus gordonii]|uniref:LPXTG-anchored fibrillar adhesin CshA n=1 Tax=Streptococcus gordonii TaxID=1302 RepID=UPI000F6FBFF1|nr:LPXTG-anchored fibrillar adhesin CshA [Streptococcus gordonii]MBZ2137528.1 YSIRK-type signal peptide-containing protein [Streptococcus gordonii]QGS43236.1 YSIRK-type signal peptide-containing protein [Streptococcus gordonii]VEE20912.1 surface-associated protein CshA [Streptococcus gordonii]
MGKDLFNPHLRKFSIRKLNVGVCSVLLSTLILLGAATQVSADETSASGVQNEVARADLAESPATATAPVASEASQNAETTVAATATEAPQTAENTAPTNSASESTEKPMDEQPVASETPQPSVEKPVLPTEVKPAENTTPASTEASPETVSPSRATDQPVATRDSVQSSRSRRLRRDLEATAVTPGTGPAGADDATPIPRVSKPTLSESEKKESTQLAKQINWVDFSDTASMKNLDPQGGFKVGTVFKKEISPGYVVTLTVTELKPFNSTEIYKKRVEGTPTANTYDPNAINSYLKGYKDYGKTPPSVTGRPQNKFSTIGGQGFDTQGRKTQIILPDDAVNWGIKFKVEATYRGNPVKPSVVMADGEDANPAEYGIFTTNGEGWEYVGEWMKGPRAKGPYTVMTEDMVKAFDKTRKDGLLILKDKSVDWSKYLSPDTVTGGLGSQVFGPIISASKAVPVVMTRGASEVGFYVATGGQQALMMGFLVVDSSDAPASYGEAYHTIGTRDSIANTPINQPYLGSTAADIDADSESDWTADDREDVADEGPAQLLTADQLSKTNDLLDLNKAKNGTYTLKIKANPNGNAKAYVKAWVDFNNNGKFDDNEGSVVKEITANGDHTLSFNAIPGLTGGLVDQIGMRVRIATNAGDIEKPTGTAFSGEVEDMLVRRVYPPQGEKQESTGFQGETQNASVHFTAKGPDRSDFVTNASMSNQAPQVLDNQGNVLTPTNGNTYVRPEGTYVVTANGDDVNVTFTPNEDFSGVAEGINIRRTDSNGSSTGWQSTDAADPNKNDRLNNMDGRFVPTVRKVPKYDSTGIQGQDQSKELVFNDGDPAKTPVTPDASRPATFVDANGQPVTGNTVPAMSNGQQVGTYELDPNTGQVTFKPNKTFVGTPDPVAVQVSDTNGVPHRARYQPTVTKVTPTGTGATSTGPQGVPQTGTPTFQGGDPLVPIDETVEPTFEDGSKEKTIPGQGTYTIAPDGTVTFTPDKQFVGNPDPVTVKRVDKNGTPVTATYSPEFTKVTPTSTDATSNGIQGQPQKGTPTFTEGNPLVPIDDTKPMTFEDGQSTKTVPGVGEYSINPDGSITFTPDKKYVGTPNPVTVKRVDKNGTEVTATYTPTVTKVTPTSTDATSNGIQGQPQKGTPTFTEGNPLVPIDDTKPMTFEDGQSTKTVPGVGEYNINPDGSITFTPDKQYVGTPDPVTVKRVDKNGTEVTATYTPTVTKVTPTSTNATSTGPQGVPQTGTPTFQGGDPLVPIDETVEPTFEDGSKEKVISGQGTYTIAPDGTVTFTPDKRFVGKPDPVTVKRVDKNGTLATAIYSPEFTKVTPTGTGATSTGPQGLPQTGTPTFQGGDPLVPIDETVEPTFEDGSKEKTIPGQGTYTIAPDGTVTFTPDKQFVGKPDPVTVKRVDKNGTPVTATYSPEFTKVTPTGTGDKTEGLQGQVQEGKVNFTPGHDSVPFPADSTPLFDNGTAVKEVPNVGKFEVDADGKVTFTPDKQFKGETPELELTRVDANGTPVTVKYQAVVKEVTPTSTDATSNGIQGQPQKGTPIFTEGNPLVPIDDTKPMTFEDGQSTKTVPGVGEYSINPDGSITFTPDKQYVGTPDPVTVKRVDKNGTEVTATYTPTVTKVTPTSTNATSTGPQGVPQTGTPTFQGGDPLVPIDETVEPTFDDGSKEKNIPGQGTYTIAPDGTVTFTPDKQFVGKPDPVTVKRVDKNGTEVTSIYTPTVTKVTPTGTGATSTGPQGLSQTGIPSFQGGDPLVPIDETVEPTFEDGSKEKSIPGQGTYTIAPDGTVTFTPDKQFVGKPDPVTVKRVDKNGTPVTATYSPEFTKVTPTGTGATSTGPQGLPQTGTPTFQGGDPLVPIDETVEPTFEDGSKEKTIPGQGTYTIAPDGTVTFTPDKQFVGKPDPVTVKRVDKNGTPVTATYSPEFTKVTPTGTGATSTGPQGLPQTGTPTFKGGDPLVPIDEAVEPTFEDGSKEKSIPGQGTYTIAPDGTVTFTPDKQFVGKPDPVTVKRVDKNGTPVTATYRPEFTKVTPTGTGATSTGPQGLPQTGTPTFQGGDPLVPIDETVEPTFEDGSKEKTIPGQGTYTIVPDGTVTFTPDKQFVGKPDPVTVKRVDKNGTPVTATYSPEFTKVTPIGKDASSENIKGLVQIGTPTFEGGDPLVPIDETVVPTFEDGSTEKVIPGEGTYTISPDGIVTFTPEADFVGKGTGVTIVRKDKNGTPVTASYRPTVVDPSTGQDTTSTGAKGQTQVATPAFEGHIDSTVPPTFEDGSTTMVVPGEGSYTIDKDGQITFTPEPDFVGTAKGVVVKRLDIYGNVVTAQYTPTVIGQTRVEDITSDGLKGQTQTGKPIFEGDVDLTVAPTFEDGSTEKVVPGEGTYTISPDGVVTFIPEPNFVGTAKGVVVIRKDRNGQTISASYTPRVTEIPVVPNRPSTPEQPKAPVIPVDPTVVVQTPKAEERVEPIYIDPKDEKGVLPRTGSQTSDQTASGLLAAIASLTFFGLANRKKKSKED